MQASEALRKLKAQSTFNQTLLNHLGLYTNNVIHKYNS